MSEPIEKFKIVNEHIAKALSTLAIEMLFKTNDLSIENMEKAIKITDYLKKASMACYECEKE